MKRHLEAELHRHDRTTLIPMLEKLTDREIEALYRMIQAVKEDSKQDGRRQAIHQPWRR